MNLPGDPPRRDHGHTSHHGVRPDDRGQDQPIDKKRAQQTSGDKTPREDARENQRDAARERPPSPGQPAGGE